MRSTPWLTDIIAADGVSSMAVENQRASERRTEYELGGDKPRVSDGPEE